MSTLLLERLSTISSVRREPRVTTRPPKGGLFVLAYGNPLRRDDGAAHLVATLLESDPRFCGEVLAVHQLTPDLAESVARWPRVCFVDARMPDADPDPIITAIAADAAPAGPLGHTFSPQQLLAFAEALYKAVPEAWLVTLPTRCIDFGETLTDHAFRGAQAAVRIIRELSQGTLPIQQKPCTS